VQGHEAAVPAVEARRQGGNGSHDRVQVVGLAQDHEGPGHGGGAGRGFFDGAEREGNSADVDHVVGHNGADDLAAQRMSVQLRPRVKAVSSRLVSSPMPSAARKPVPDLRSVTLGKPGCYH
jgi:hypothetical protein